MTTLFNFNETLHDQLRKHVAKANEPLATATLAQLADEREWIARLSRAMTVSPIALDLDGATTTDRETSIREPQYGRSRAAVQYSVRIPFTGDKFLLYYQASHRISVSVDAEVDHSAIVFSEVFSQPVESERVKAWRREQADRLVKLVGFANADVETHNLAVESMAAAAYASRKATLEVLRDAKEQIGATGI